MANKAPEWERLEEFEKLAQQLIEKYPRFAGIDVTKIICYAVTNKEKPKKKVKPYDMSAEGAPECFTNTKQYFVKVYKSDWDAMYPELKQWVAASALDRIDPEQPGKLGPLDYRDQSVMVKTVGADWHNRTDLPNLLTKTVEFRE